MLSLPEAQESRKFNHTRSSQIVVCTAETDGLILPDRPVSFPDLSYKPDFKSELFNEREISIISNAVKHNATIVCLSCVESVKEVREARHVLNKARGNHMQIYSKIQSV